MTCPAPIHRVYEEVPLPVFRWIAVSCRFADGQLSGRCPECAELLFHRGEKERARA